MDLTGSLGSTLRRLRYLHTLTIAPGAWDVRTLYNLVGTPLVRLRELRLPALRIGDLQAAVLAAGWWPDLEVLDLSRNSITSRGLEALTGSPWAKLHTLLLSFNMVDDGCGCLLPRWASRARVLDLSWNDTTSAALESFHEQPWHHLERLNFYDTGSSGDEAIARLARASLPRLQELYVELSGLTARAVRSLAATSWFAGLRALDMSGNDALADDGIVELTASCAWESLEVRRRCTSICICRTSLFNASC